MERHKSPPPSASGRPRWLSMRGYSLPRNRERIAAIDAPETILTVQFEGLTEAEQRAAIAGFPGGRRFRLAQSRH
jgi:hypothetical protein